MAAKIAREKNLLCPMFTHADAVLTNMAECVTMLAIYLPDITKTVVRIGIKSDRCTLSEFTHNVIPGMPIFHTLIYGVLPAMMIDTTIYVQVDDDDIIPTKIVSYGYNIDRILHLYADDIEYGPFIISKHRIVVKKYCNFRSAKRISAAEYLPQSYF